MFLHNTVKIITVLTLLQSKKENSSEKCRSFLSISVHTHTHTLVYWGFPGGTSGKEPSCQCGKCMKDAGLTPGSGRSPEGGHGNPLQYPCLENPMDRGPWWAAVYTVTQSWTRLKQLNTRTHIHVYDFSVSSVIKNLPVGSISGPGRSPGQGNGNPLQYSPESHRQRSLACYSPWGCKKSDTTQQLNSNNVYSWKLVLEK